MQKLIIVTVLAGTLEGAFALTLNSIRQHPLEDAGTEFSAQTQKYAKADSEGIIMEWKGKPITDALNDPKTWTDKDFLTFISAGRWPKNAKGPTNGGSMKEYLETCQADNEDITVKSYQGRAGNNIAQMFNAIFLAYKTGRKNVRLPQHRFFNFPKTETDYQGRSIIPVDPAKVKLDKKCDFMLLNGVYDCQFAAYQTCKTTFMERKKMVEAYILPYLSKNITERCKREPSDVLTIHLRSGDAAGGNAICHSQPHCDYYDQILNRGNNGGPWRKAKLIASSQVPVNACVEQMLSKHKDKKIEWMEGRSEEEDYCAQMMASNLAISNSGFSTTAKMFNTGIQKIFYPEFAEERCWIQDGVEKTNKKEILAWMQLLGDLNIHKEICGVYPGAVEYHANKTNPVEYNLNNAVAKDLDGPGDLSWC